MLLASIRSVAIAAAVSALLFATTPSAAADGDSRLPEVVNAPGTWSGVERVSGPVAAIGIASRTRPVGVFDKREFLALFAVSAADGVASWIRLPGFSLERWGFTGGVAVSPDGRWIGWVRPAKRAATGAAQRVDGWSVMDTTTGRVRHLGDPDFARVRGTMADLAFTGDSRFLLTSYEPPGQPRKRGHQFVAWDVSNGRSMVIEEPGRYWLPSLGSAPTGVVWSRGRDVFRADPVSGERSTVTLPRPVVTASWGPDDEAFAYVGRPAEADAPWRLYAGRTVAEARSRVVDLPRDINPSEILGWRDSTHVVVGHHRRVVHVVDVVTGEVEKIDLAGYGDHVNAPHLASGLWQQPLLTPGEPEGTTDPRRPWRWAGAAAVVVAVLAGLRWSSRRSPSGLGQR